MRQRIENEVFFASGTSAQQPIVAESVFYAHRARPPAETPLSVRLASHPARFALALFLVGWAGILFQRNFLQQVVIGAPVFEELAKLGPPLLLVVLLRIRTLWLRLPLAWASGAAFGIMEHYVTYAEEDAFMFAERIAFHAVTPGLSILFWGAFEDMPDVRARWAATVPASLFHWANNFLAALVLGIALAVLGLPAEIQMGFAVLLTGIMIGITVVAMLRREAFEARSRRLLETAMPRLGMAPPTTTALPDPAPAPSAGPDHRPPA